MAKTQVHFDSMNDLFDAYAAFRRARGYLAFAWMCFVFFLFIFPTSLIRIVGWIGLFGALIVILIVFSLLMSNTVQNELRGYNIRSELAIYKKKKRDERRKSVKQSRRNGHIHYVIGDDGELVAMEDEPERAEQRRK